MVGLIGGATVGLIEGATIGLMEGAMVALIEGAMVALIEGAMVALIECAMVALIVGAMVALIVGAMVALIVGAVVGAGVHVAVVKGPGPFAVHSGGFPACTTASCGSHNASPLLVHGLPPHHTQGSLAIFIPLYVVADRPSRDFRHVPSSLMKLQPWFGSVGFSASWRHC